MARYTGPSYKKARHVGFSISETGKELARRPYGPGQHGNARRGKLSDYGTQLKEKQKVRFMYGVNERQFRNTFDKASKLKGVTGTNFLRMLESRLDNLVNHGHVTVNGKKVDIPSYQVKVGDVISIKEDHKNLKVVTESLAKVTKRVDFITYDEGKMEGTYVRLPERNELNADINEALIVEFYNK